LIDDIIYMSISINHNNPIRGYIVDRYSNRKIYYFTKPCLFFFFFFETITNLTLRFLLAEQKIIEM
jgi:hypothetical protein